MHHSLLKKEHGGGSIFDTSSTKHMEENMKILDWCKSFARGSRESAR